MEHTTSPQKKKKFKPIYVFFPLVLIVGGWFGYKKIQHALHYEVTDNAQVQSNAMPVLSRVAGYIDSLNLRDYQEVKPGETLVVLDDREYRIAVAQAEANLLTAEADLANARASVANMTAAERVASANTAVLKTREEKAQTDLARDEALFKEGAITRKQLEDSRSNAQAAHQQSIAGGQQISQASAQGGTIQAQIAKAEAVIATRKAELENARLRLSYARIVAPTSGRIGKLNLAAGQYVQPGQPLFTIVNNETFWIVANYKETQLKNLSIGQPVEVSIDGYPKLKIQGRITSFSEATGAQTSLLPPDNASGNFVKVTQRVPVKIEFDITPELRKILKAGLSVTVEARVD
ncbi:HlyD family secretion protein [Nostoc ellipsosporum NOK]|jgi:membrane fusion protein (multidrug efflux system)|nr:HlyD family secretion protein [Nostoc ellipsosporum NOK]